MMDGVNVENYQKFVKEIKCVYWILDQRIAIGIVGQVFHRIRFS
jgi:hypothetical protein